MIGDVEIPPEGDRFIGQAVPGFALDRAPFVRCRRGRWRLSFRPQFGGSPTELSLRGERQGETLCYSPDGAAFLTMSEGKSPRLYETRAALPAPAP